MIGLARRFFLFIKWFLERIDVEIVVPVLRWFVRLLSKKTGPVLSPVEYHAAWKTKAMEDFGQWLSEIPDSRPASKFADVESCDLFTLLSEFSALRQEIRFQNREQARTVGSFDEMFAVVHEAADMFKARSKEIATLEENIRLSCEKRTSVPFFDVRDALLRGRSSAQAVMDNKSFFRPLPKGMDGVVEGYEMALRRMDKALESMDVFPVDALGQAFDPKTMKAIGTEKAPGKDPGVVIEQVAGGFVRKGEILKTARVIVSE